MANRLPLEKKITAISMLCENSSIRAIERITGVHQDTIMRLGVRVGEGCREIMDRLFIDLDSKVVQVDEIWGFIGAKAKTTKRKRLPADFGDIWTWIAIDAETKLIPSFVTGKRDQYHANTFLGDLANRLNSRPQISSDALASYEGAIERAFGCEVDYGQVIKTFADKDVHEERRYSPAKVVSVKKVVVAGNPDERVISTSYIEKQNQTLRMHCRRLSRLTNAFSKKRENFDAAVALHFAYYNLVKTHGTIKCTPAMEAGVTETHWTVADLVEMIES